MNGLPEVSCQTLFSRQSLFPYLTNSHIMEKYRFFYAHWYTSLFHPLFIHFFNFIFHINVIIFSSCLTVFFKWLPSFLPRWMLPNDNILSNLEISISSQISLTKSGIWTIFYLLALHLYFNTYFNKWRDKK